MSAVGVYRRHGRRCTGAENCGCPWAYTIELPSDADGKRRQVTKSGFVRQADAKAARAEIERAHRRNELAADRSTTVGQYAEPWLAGKVERGELRPTTERAYRAHIRDHIVPVLGRKRLAEVKARDVEAMLAGARKQHDDREAERVRHQSAIEDAKPRDRRQPVRPAKALSAASQVRLLATVRSMMNDAIRDDVISLNPCAKVRMPKGERHRVTAWEPEQARRFLTDPTVVASPVYVALYLAVTTGLRRGEVCGLRWSDVDLGQHRLTVRQSITVVGHDLVTGPPKSDAGTRVVDLDAATVATLRAWRMRQAEQRLALGEAWEDTDDRVVTVEGGRALHPERLTKSFIRLARALGMPTTRLHGLRHTAVSLQLSSGVPLAVIAKRIGHSQVSLTSDVYGHLIGGAGREAADRSAALLWGR